MAELTLRETKALAIEKLRAKVPQMRQVLAEYDERLALYYEDLCEHSGVDDNDENDHHNMYELLAALKLLRLMDKYVHDVAKAQMVIKLREGQWHKEGSMWIHDTGGLLLPGSRGQTYYRWMNFQVFVLVAMYGLQAWVDTEVKNGTRKLLPSEREGEGGTIEDLRRLCTDFTFYAPRKTDKTGLSAYNNFIYFMLEDADSEIMCTANSQTQSKILYERTQLLIKQMDPNAQRIRFTAVQTNWKLGQPRSAKLSALSAGGKTKDGLYAQLCCADEFGSAPYVNGKSDMGALVNVILSSMGPRREPMMFTSTTAGTITTGPFIDKLDGIKQALLSEVNGELSETSERQLLDDPNDRWMILPLMPDEWQTDEEVLFTSKAIRKKVNPALGIIVQNSFYDQQVADSRLDPLKKIETKTKLFNVYERIGTRTWIPYDKIQRLQIPQRIEECTVQKGWAIFCGMDFSMGDDLWAHTYLAVNKFTGEIFADMDAWITRSTLESISIRPMYERWIEEGWLHLVEGQVIPAGIPVRRIMDLFGMGIDFYRFGYDAYKSPDPINQLKAWIFSMNRDPKAYLIPVSQTNAAYNQPVEQITLAVMEDPAVLHFSSNPMWPWEFQNVAIDKDLRYENKKPLKAHPGSDACKVDNVQALCNGWIVWNQYEGSQHAE